MDSKGREKNKIFLMFLFLLVMIGLSFCIGRYSISIGMLLKTLKGFIIGDLSGIPNNVITVLTKIRIPRILAAILIGGSLALSGSSYQALFKNPMVSPDILGASQGAAFGAALGLILNYSYIKVSLISFLFGIISVSLTYFISSKFKVDRTLGLVLSGMMVSSINSSLVSFVKLIADTDNTLPAITYWLMGSLASIKTIDVKMIFIPMGLGILVTLLLGWKMNLLTMGEDEAKSMGVNTNRLRFVIVISSTLMTTAAVSISGMIGWVGLIIPHIARMIVGNDYRYVLPASMLLGSSFLLLVDNLARNLTTAEIPLGILTSFIGAPIFIYLILKRGYD